MRVDRRGRVHDEHGRFSPVLWRTRDRAGRCTTLTEVALRHARGEDESRRERRTYLTASTIQIAVELGHRHADLSLGRERLIANGIGPSAHLAVVVETHASGATVITAFATRRVPDTWRPL